MRLGFCDSCADEAGIFSALIKVESLLHGYGVPSPVDSAADDPEMPVEFAEECSVCGTGLRDFERDFTLGCDNCAKIFGSLLFNFVSLLSPSPIESRLKPLYPGEPPSTYTYRRQAQRINGEIKKQLGSENYREAETRSGQLGRIDTRINRRRPSSALASSKDFALAGRQDKLLLLTGKPSYPSADTPWIESRIEAHRNLAEYTFPPAMDDSGRLVLKRFAASILPANILSSARLIEYSQLDQLQRLALDSARFSRHLSPSSSIVMLGSPDRLFILNDQDHFQIVHSGSETNPEKAIEPVRELLAILDKKADPAFSGRFGYLTSSPKNMGAGISVSVLVHIPFSLAHGRTELFPARAERAGVRFEPYCGPGIERHGFFKISSFAPFNATEEQIVARVFDFASHVCKEELALRNNLPPQEVRRLEKLMEKVLTHSMLSYRLSYQDALRLASFLTIGAVIGCEGLCNFSLESVIPGLSSPAIMLRDRRRHTINECEKRRADIFADIVESCANPLLASKTKRNIKDRDAAKSANTAVK